MRADLSARLLAWYDRNARRLPWRMPPGVGGADPYRVWLSEIMLQQTRAAVAGPYYERFLQRWPTVRALAAAQQADVLAAWAGLGYYARARNLHRCAQIVAETMGGVFPDTETGLAALPGVGAYTAAAIAAIAFDRPAAAVDGNVERVMARLYGVDQPLPGAKTKLRTLAAALVPARRAGDYAQAVMDLGATICTPAKPVCGLCPWSEGCVARQAGNADDLPARAPAKARPIRHGVAFWLERASDRAVLLRRRPQEGLLGGMVEVPGTPWRGEKWEQAEALEHAPVAGEWNALRGGVRHTFTHFQLELTVLAARTSAEVEGQWCVPADLDEAGLPSVMQKVVKVGRRAG
ncbi:MAG: A/G-specific adenine glycosylase [Alphaproteobacteria bacterium]|nr:A/G-specific adenine glycosylase [Alphaproteobacteria bacterium]